MKRKQILSSLILGVLCCSFLPAAAWASDTEIPSPRSWSPERMQMRRRTTGNRVVPLTMMQDQRSHRTLGISYDHQSATNDPWILLDEVCCCCVPSCCSVPTCVGCCFTGVIMALAAVAQRAMNSSE